MSYTPLPFTFGVEIEHVLAIVRTTLYEAYRHESAERLGHNKPALFVLPEGEVDGYNPLQTLHLKLKHNGLDAKFHEEDGEEEDRRSDYGTWNVTSDSSIRYDISRQQMEAEFQKARPSASRHGRWRLDSDYSFEGVELVSPPLRVPDIDGNSGGMDEVTRYLDVVLNGENVRPRLWHYPPHEASRSTPAVAMFTSDSPTTKPFPRLCCNISHTSYSATSP